MTLEGSGAARRGALTGHELTLLSSAQDAELFLLGAGDHAALRAQVERLESFATRLSCAELADLAACLAKLPQDTSVRAALVASTPVELGRRLRKLHGWLTEAVTRRFDGEAGVFLGAEGRAPRVAFLFPGQASPVRLDGGALARRFGAARELYERAGLPQAGETLSTAIAQPAIIAAEIAGLRVLKSFGVQAEVAVGHSLGELAGLYWAGALDEDALLRIAKVRGRAMAEVPGPQGAMASLAASASAVGDLDFRLQGEGFHRLLQFSTANGDLRRKGSSLESGREGESCRGQCDTASRVFSVSFSAHGPRGEAA